MYVPAATVNNSVEVVEDCADPSFRATFHVAPEGKPLSVKVNPYVGVNVTVCVRLELLTVIDPDEGEQRKFAGPVTENWNVPGGNENTSEVDVDD